MSGSKFFVGLDLGQAHDYSALSVVERVEIPGAWDVATFTRKTATALRLRYLERITLNTPYPDVVARAGMLTRCAELSGRCQLIVDATGCGRPVVDLLRRARVECSILPVTITSGVGETFANNYYHVPKRDLVAGVQVALQTESLQIAAGLRYAPALLAELTAMRVSVSAARNESFGAGRRGEHDDLVIALALSLWGLRKVYPRSLSGEAVHREVGPGWRGGA